MNGMTIGEAIKKGIVQPGKASVHVNRPLTNMSLAIMQNADGFVADKVFPRLPVAKQSDSFFTYPRGEFNRAEMQRRAPGAESAGATYKVGTDSYLCHVWALHRDIDWQTRANSDTPINLDREATMYLTLQGMLRTELEWTNAFLKDGVWTFSVDGATTRALTDLTSDAANNAQYWNMDSSKPIEDVRFAATTMQKATGFRPNKLVLSRPVYDVLLDHADIIARFDRGQTSGVALANREKLAMIFDVEEVLVASAIQNTAKEGQTDAHDWIVGKHALLAYAPPSPGILTPSAGYVFDWTGLTGTGGPAIEKWYSQDRKSDRVEINAAFVPKQLAADLGCFFNDIIQ